VTNINVTYFYRCVAHGESVPDGWGYIPFTAVAVILALTCVGLQRRISEHRL
jgi:hypothetical protein